MNKPWKVIFAFVAVFAAGAVVGGVFGGRRIAKRFRVDPAPVVNATVPPAGAVTPAAASENPIIAAAPKEAPRPVLAPPLPAPQLRQWTQRFNLTVEQRKKIGPIIQGANTEFARLRAETTKVQEGMYADISEILTDDQRADLEEMKKKFQERIELERRKQIEQRAADTAAKKSGIRPQSE